MTRSILPSLLLLMTVLAGAAGADQPEATDATETATERPRVEIATSMGTIVVELFPDEAPRSVENFLGYVQKGFYDGTIFHRVIDGFMIQGGGFEPDLTLKTPDPTIVNEADNGLVNKRGTLAMARRGDAHSASSQFYINHVDNPALDHKSKADGRSWGYAVFGEVVAGMDVVDAIAEVPTGRGPRGMGNVPLDPVLIEGAVWVNPPPAAESGG